MARGRGERSLAAVAFESTEKTAPASGFYFLPHMSNGLALDRGLVEDDLVGTRDPGDADLDVANVAGDIGIPIDLEAVGFWLKALMGAPTSTDETTHHSHTFESGAWSLPSFSLEKQVPDVPSYEMFRGCRADNLRLTLQRGGRVNGTVGVIGQAVTAPASSTAAGTPSSYALSRFMQRQASVEIDGSTQANVVSADFTFSNNLDQVDTVTGDEFIGGLDPMRAAMTGNLRLRFASESLFDTAKAGTPIALSFVLTKSAAEKLTLAMPRVFLSVPGRPVEGPGGIEANFSFMAARDTDDSAMLTATLLNEVESY
ncbi:phage tail tube protein [Mameliella sp.]|uniref:phage tail tube protein n=1 Tax=Mameliella sp. TaxID=1924940 RepID=UPI003BAB569A